MRVCVLYARCLVCTGDHVVVDVNYFPSCADVDDAPAALRAAMLDVIVSA